MRSRTLFAVIVLAALVPGACDSPEERERAYLRNGLEFFEGGQYDMARLEFMNARQINPINVPALYYLGRIAERQGHWRDAFAGYMGVVEQDPSHIDANLRLGHLFLVAGDVAAARKRADQVIGNDDRNAEAHALRGAAYLSEDKLAEADVEAQYALALEQGNVSAAAVMAGVHRRRGRHAAALDSLDEAIAVHSESQSLRVLKIALQLEQDKHEQAANTFRELLALDPDNTSYRIGLARAYIAAADLDAAEAVLREAVARQPDNDQAKLVLIDFLANQGDFGTARQAIEDFIAAAPDSYPLRFGLAELYSRNDMRTQAEQVFREIVARDRAGPQGLSARVRLARLRLAQDDKDGARRWIEDVLHAEPANADALLLRAWLALSGADFTAAIIDLRSVLSNDPRSTEALSLLAQAHLGKREPELAEDSLRRLIDIDATSHAARLQLSRLIAEDRRYDEAISLLDRILTDAPRSLVVLATKADILVAQRRLAEAKAVAAMIGTFKDGEPIALSLVGKVALAEQRYADAVMAYEKAYRQAPDPTNAMRGLVRAYAGLGKLEDAAGVLGRAIEENPDEPDLLVLLGDVESQLGDGDAAIQAYRRAVELAVSTPSAYLRLAQLYAKRETLDQAIDVLQAAHASNPGVEDIGLALGMALQNAERFTEAIALYEQILESSPRSTVAANNLAALIADHDNQDTTRLQRALDLAEGFQTSDNPLLIDTLGWVHYRLGSISQAILFLKQAVQLSPSNGELNYHLGMAYLADNQTESARAYLTNALGDGGTSYFTADVRQVLAELDARTDGKEGAGP